MTKSCGFDEPVVMRLITIRLPDHEAKNDPWSVVIGVALASPGDQTYTSGPVEASSGIAEKASTLPLGDQSGGAPALWTLSRIDSTANPGTALAGGALG